MDIVSWIKTTLSKYSSNNTHDKNAIYFVKNEDGKTGKIISDEVVYGNGGDANGVVVESPNQPTGGESVWVNPNEDPEEVEVYSRQQTDALINTKQNELTLTVKDNGNIVIGNIQGQTKEFMPATPSGDPMHYTYEAAGAVYNDTGKDIVKTTPWTDLADDDADKTVVHKAGYWYLNGLGDITNEQMRRIYIATAPIQNYWYRYCCAQNVRTNIFTIKELSDVTINIFEISDAFLRRSTMEVVRIPTNSTSIDYSAPCPNLYNINNLRFVIGIFLSPKQAIRSAGIYNLQGIKIYGLTVSVYFESASKLSIKSVLYMIQNEAATSAITITLHADAYARAIANADIVAALEAHPNVSLASA